MNNFAAITKAGQSLWFDNIQRRLLINGELAGMISRGEIRGITSNPSLFHNAISKSTDYDQALKPMAWAGWNSTDIFYQLAVEDIQAAADLFAEVYKQTDRTDGFVSIEVSPFLANDTEGTFAEAVRLWKRVDRPNLMVKIPATPEGIPAVRKAIAAGININITLIFSLERYSQVIDAFLSGLEDRLAAGKPINRISSVASFFVSRVDSKIDSLLQNIQKMDANNAEKAASAMGKAGIANARLAYALFEDVFSSARFKLLSKHGAQLQRPLWASTSTKNPAYRDVMYVEELIGPNTVNTVPPQTLIAFGEHGKVANALAGKKDDSTAVMTSLYQLGISMVDVTQQLEIEGVKTFAVAYTALLETIESRCLAAQRELGSLARHVEKRIKNLQKTHVSERIHQIDPTLWTDDPASQAEIRHRMGWLQSPYDGLKQIQTIRAFIGEIQSAGYSHALILGMGGSSLAPEVLAFTFGIREDIGALGLDLAILDSTDADQVYAAAIRSPIEKTLYIVSSKSGETAEVNAFLDFFWARAVHRLGKNAADHFIAITDPGTSLAHLAEERKFRRVFLADPSVGGRYSALTAFGLVPAAIIGIDPAIFLQHAISMAEQCAQEVPAGRNPGLVLGAVLGEAALQGRDKLTLITDPELSAMGSWLEQLIAESSGKQGKGILPVPLEPASTSWTHSKDRIFVYLRKSGTQDSLIEKLQKARRPTLVLDVPSEYDLAAEFYRWEFATATACAVIHVNSFDQPDVQDSKTRTKVLVDQFKSINILNEGTPIWKSEEALVYGSPFAGLESAKTLSDVVLAFLNLAKSGDYVSLNAYLPRNIRTFTKLQKLRKAILKRTRVATTLGFGPRFLHSTGQFHKGGPNTGLFIQLTQNPKKNLEIPEEGMTFRTLERAQSLGDFEALQARGRRVIRIHLINADIAKLIQ